MPTTDPITSSKLDISGYAPPDKRFGKPFIDVDEWRDSPRKHRYIHGGFDETHTRFSFYLPPKEDYRGRFFQFLEGGAGGHETLIAASGYGPTHSFDWQFWLCHEELGGYMVESNQGHFPGEGTGFGNDIELWAASAETALFGKYLAGLVYAEQPRYGYVWGVSGGGARSCHCLEQRPDVWQGGSPHAGVGQTTQWSTWALTWLLARGKFPQIIDATEPGGSGNPFEGLTHQQREALADLYRRGYPRGAEIQLAPFSAWAFTMYSLQDEDPQYFEDFWTKPGYLGHDDPGSLQAIRVATQATVKQVFPASKVPNQMAQMYGRLATAGAGFTDPTWGVSLDIDVEDLDLLFMSKVKILSGKATGRELLICNIDDGIISPFSEITPDVFQNVEPGDRLVLDNRDFVAFCYYHRHTIANTDGHGGIFPELLPWTVDGRPVYPQRESPGMRKSGPLAYKAAMTSKMIYVHPTLDNMVWPTSISSYYKRVKENLGERIDENFRLWFVENARHGQPTPLDLAIAGKGDLNVWLSRLVSYDGTSAQALRDLVGWVEQGAPAHASGGYDLTRDNRLVLPATAAERKGVQPVVTLTADGGVRAQVKVGQALRFLGAAEQPPGAGSIVVAEWDLEGAGAFTPVDVKVDGSSPTIEVTISHAYAKPGVYFPSFRVGAQCDGAKCREPLIRNLARVRVFVSS